MAGIRNEFLWRGRPKSIIKVRNKKNYYVEDIMRIYIAASWKHQHAVEMLTDLLEVRGHTILSWIREGRPEEAFLSQKELTHFIESPEGERVFDFCISSVTSADLLIYIGPS